MVGKIILLWIAGISAAMQFAKFSVSFENLVKFIIQTTATLTGASLFCVGLLVWVFLVSSAAV